MSPEPGVLRLARRAKLRLDKRTGDTFLLYPERGLRLNATAAEILRMVEAGLDCGDIVRILSHQYGKEPSGVRSEVFGFLDILIARGLLEGPG